MTWIFKPPCNIAPENKPGPKRTLSSSKHPFSGRVFEKNSSFPASQAQTPITAKDISSSCESPVMTICGVPGRWQRWWWGKLDEGWGGGGSAGWWLETNFTVDSWKKSHSQPPFLDVLKETRRFSYHRIDFSNLWWVYRMKHQQMVTDPDFAPFELRLLKDGGFPFGAKNRLLETGGEMGAQSHGEKTTYLSISLHCLQTTFSGTNKTWSSWKSFFQYHGNS